MIIALSYETDPLARYTHHAKIIAYPQQSKIIAKLKHYTAVNICVVFGIIIGLNLINAI